MFQTRGVEVQAEGEGFRQAVKKSVVTEAVPGTVRLHKCHFGSMAGLPDKHA
jgi:hypothetical protein